MKTLKSFPSYTYSDGMTGMGQFVQFTCQPGDAGKVKEFLQEKVRTIDVPITGCVAILHGGCSRYTRYDITQHDYAGGGGYIEVLEIKNPPDGRCSIVIYEYAVGSAASFTEWETLEQARAAFVKVWGVSRSSEESAKFPGFKRLVPCGALTPWFYAIGDEALIGDYAFPQGLQDDPVYRVGRKFVVTVDDVPVLKTCMGTRVVEEKASAMSSTKGIHRCVYWDDGSVWKEGKYNMGGPPIPADEGHVWIAEAVQQFRKLIAGGSTEFTLNFTDGNKFVGKVVQPKHKNPCAAGDYRLLIKVAGEEKSREGWVNEFSPTPEATDPIQFARTKFAEKGKELEYAEIKEVKNKKGGKKWSGVFHGRTS